MADINWAPLMLLSGLSMRMVGIVPQHYGHPRVSLDGRIIEICGGIPPASQNTDRPEYSPKQGLPLTRSLFSGLSLRAVALSSILADCNNYPDDIYREATNY